MSKNRIIRMPEVLNRTGLARTTWYRVQAVDPTAPKALVWDNVTGVFDSASMAAFITADAMVDRILGKSEAIRIPNRALLILTGRVLPQSLRCGLLALTVQTRARFHLGGCYFTCSKNRCCSFSLL